MKKLALLFLSIILISCNEKSTNEEATMDGVWQSVGYGRIVKIVDGNYKMADVTAVSCIPILEGEISEFGEALTFKNDTITLEDGINFYYFTRIDDAPLFCKQDTPEGKAVLEKADDPEYNFEVLWNTFNEHYAYFELRKINWDSMYKHYRPMVTKETTQVELFLVMDEMLNAFEDGHIGLDAPSEIIKEAYDKPIAATTPSEEKPAPKKVKLRKHEVASSVANKYIPNGTSRKNGNVRWGMLDGNIGYIQINQMMALADYGISDTLSYRDYWMAYFDEREGSLDSTKDELQGFNKILDTIMNELGGTNSLIIDVRFNGGGKDEVGMAMLERLNSEEKVVFTKKGRLGDGFTPIVRVVQDASENSYTAPVYLLISTESASATEIMALSSLSMKNITRIGSSTEGVFSDILDKGLPNEWTFGLSSEVYETMDGINYESIGIPADIDVGYSRDTQLFLGQVMTDLENTGDLSIERALQLIKDI